MFSFRKNNVTAARLYWLDNGLFKKDEHDSC